MIKHTITVQLNYIKDALTLNCKITDATIDLYHDALRHYPDKLVKDVVKELCRKWDKRFLPPPVIISGLCDGKTNYSGDDDPQEKERRLQEKREYGERKQAHKVEVLNFVKRIVAGQPLTDYQQKAYDMIDKHMVMFGERDPKEELKQLNNPYGFSYTGLYMDFLEGKLTPLTGKQKGDLLSTFTLNKPKAYDEGHFKKEKARDRSLKLEEQRNLGIF